MNVPTAPKVSASDFVPAPWFYRMRFAVFGIVYGLAFFVGFTITGVAGIVPVPVYQFFGRPIAGAAIAALFVLGGFALRVWASSYLSSAIVWQADPQSPELRVCGPYRFTRNPPYLGNVLQALGIGLAGPWPAFACVVLAVTAFDHALIFVEERFLSVAQGEACARYRATVPRMFPVPGRAAPAAAQRASLRDGLRAEAVIGAFGVVAFAVLLANATIVPGAR